MAILHNSSELTASTENSKFEWKLTVRSTILSVIKFVAKFLKKHYNCSDQFKTKEKNIVINNNLVILFIYITKISICLYYSKNK